MFRELVAKNRSYRRFHEDRPIERARLVELVEVARLCPSGCNMQPLRYLLSADASTNGKIFPHLRWAALLKDWPGPAEGERPSGYVVILRDRSVAHPAGVDHGIVAQTMLLQSVDFGLGGCMVGAFDESGLRRALAIDEGLELLLVVALGVPAETVVIEEAAGGDVAYWRSADGVHHVPKRSLEALIVE